VSSQSTTDDDADADDTAEQQQQQQQQRQRQPEARRPVTPSSQRPIWAGARVCRASETKIASIRTNPHRFHFHPHGSRQYNINLFHLHP